MIFSIETQIDFENSKAYEYLGVFVGHNEREIFGDRMIYATWVDAITHTHVGEPRGGWGYTESATTYFFRFVRELT